MTGRISTSSSGNAFPPFLAGSVLAFFLLIALLTGYLWTLVIRGISSPPTGALRQPFHAHEHCVRYEPQRRILVLNSYHYGYSWSDNEMRGIVETLQHLAPAVEAVVEHLDCKRVPGMKHFPRLVELFREKHAGSRFDLVIAADNPALEFALQERDSLFSGIPIVFCGINGFDPAKIANRKDVTGIAEILDGGSTLKQALLLQPGVKKVLVVFDRSITGRSSHRETMEQLTPFVGRVQIQCLDDLPMSTLLRHLEKASSDTIVLALSYSMDKDGTVYDHHEIAELMGKHSPVPVYVMHEERVGHGVVGGRVLGGYGHGMRAVQLALDIFRGTAPASIPVDLKSPSSWVFDYAQLKRFGLPVDRLPPDAVLLNRPVSFFEQYKDIVLATVSLVALLTLGIVILVLNIIRLRISEAANLKLQQELSQSQKMESIGFLAGGIAHDFNNILMSIIGYAELSAIIAKEDSKLGEYLRHIKAAGNKAARLTGQLLAFSRKQALHVKPLDLRLVVREMHSILKSILREDIELVIHEDGFLKNILADRTQVEQILMNLVVNARDAMPDGGRLTIETRQVDVTPALMQKHGIGRAGDYAMLTVTDTGVGIPPDIQSKVFEPFFTTKQPGKGTGLGLSTVYGIVKQHGGHIDLSSEPGKGASFSVFLPVTAEEAHHEPAQKVQVARGKGTILVVDDDPTIGKLLTDILQPLGYTIMLAVGPREAIETSNRVRERIDVLLTDVIMPEMNGRKLAETLVAGRPDLKVVYMSGYTDDIIARHGILDENIELIHKPVAPNELAERLRAIIG